MALVSKGHLGGRTQGRALALWSFWLSVRGMRAAVGAHDEPMGEDGPPWVYRVPWEGS